MYNIIKDKAKRLTFQIKVQISLTAELSKKRTVDVYPIESTANAADNSLVQSFPLSLLHRTQRPLLAPFPASGMAWPGMFVKDEQQPRPPITITVRAGSGSKTHASNM